MKKGFYYINSKFSRRCYYLTGEKKGNKWIDIAGWDDNHLIDLPAPIWMALLWTCLPTEDELKDSEYSEENPTNHILNLK